MGIPLETGQKQYSVDYKLETYLKIARLYLEDEDPVQGEAYINRAAILLTQTKNDGLQIIYKVCQGRVLDYKRKFIEAASRYPSYIFNNTCFYLFQQCFYLLSNICSIKGTMSSVTRQQSTTLSA